MVWVQLGYPVVMFMAGLQRIDPHLYEAADLDGATWWQRFTSITVPMIRPEIYVVLRDHDDRGAEGRSRRSSC